MYFSVYGINTSPASKTLPNFRNRKKVKFSCNFLTNFKTTDEMVEQNI